MSPITFRPSRKGKLTSLLIQFGEQIEGISPIYAETPDVQEALNRAAASLLAAAIIVHEHDL